MPSFYFYEMLVRLSWLPHGFAIPTLKEGLGRHTYNRKGNSWLMCLFSGLRAFHVESIILYHKDSHQF